MKYTLPFMRKKDNGFTVLELLVVIVLIGIFAAIVTTMIRNGRYRAHNAAIVLAMSSIDSGIDIEKYPGSLEDLCFEFEGDSELSEIRTYVESLGGIWHCDSTVDDYRIYVQLHMGVVISKMFVENAYAESLQHSFGNYYCVNSRNEKGFTHWPGDNLVYPSCNDVDYISEPVDPEPEPEPTPDPDPETPDPPVEGGGSCGGGKAYVCHFGNTLCVSSRALNAHTKNGDTEGPC